MQYMPSIGKIMRLLLLLLLLAALAGCQSTRVEEARISADAQISIAESQAQAQRDIAYTTASAKAAVANSQKEATIAVSNNQLASDRYLAEQATQRASIWADKLPLLAVILTFALLAAIVLVYRGRIGLVRAEVLLLSPPSPAPSRSLPSPPAPQLSLPSWTPEPVRVVAIQRRADRVSENAAGEWLLWQDGRLLLTMRPKQLTDSQRS